jgi:hypothetical protein
MKVKSLICLDSENKLAQYADLKPLEGKYKIEAGAVRTMYGSLLVHYFPDLSGKELPKKTPEEDKFQRQEREEIIARIVREKLDDDQKEIKELLGDGFTVRMHQLITTHR